MNYKLILLTTCVGILTACQTSDTIPQTTETANLSIAEQIAITSCSGSGSERRDKWLGSSQPSWDDYVAGHKKNSSDPVTKSSVAMAYKAWLDSGKDHEKAGMMFDQEHPDWAGKYPSRAKCFVQYQ